MFSGNIWFKQYRGLLHTRKSPDKKAFNLIDYILINRFRTDKPEDNAWCCLQQ